MKCGGCQSNVEKALADAPGVVSVAVDLEAKTVTVGGDFDRADVTKRITDLGFQVS